MTARDVLLAHMSEHDWQQQMVEWARRGGWHGAHVRRSLTAAHGYAVWYGLHAPRHRDDHDDGRGIPDWLLVHPERKLLLLPELKTVTGRVSVEQKLWQQWLHDATFVGAPTWRPNDAEVVREMLLGRRL